MFATAVARAAAAAAAEDEDWGPEVAAKKSGRGSAASGESSGDSRCSISGVGFRTTALLSAAAVEADSAFVYSEEKDGGASSLSWPAVEVDGAKGVATAEGVGGAVSPLLESRVTDVLADSLDPAVKASRDDSAGTWW